MAQPASSPQSLPTDFACHDFDHHVVQFPTRYASYVPREVPATSASQPAFGILPTPDGGKVVWALR